MRLLAKLKDINWLRQLYKYALTGASSVSFQLLLLFLLNSILNIYYIQSSIIAFVIAASYAFSLHNFWSFKGNKRQGNFQKYVIFIGINLIILLLNTFCIYFLVDKLNFIPIIAQAVITPILGTLNFYLQKFITFIA